MKLSYLHVIQPFINILNVDNNTREIHPLEPQRHRHSMLAPRVCAPRVTRCSLGHVIWSVQLACSILSRSDSCQGDGRQRHLMMHGQCPIPVYSSQITLDLSTQTVLTDRSWALHFSSISFFIEHWKRFFPWQVWQLSHFRIYMNKWYIPYTCRCHRWKFIEHHSLVKIWHFE